jgi:hypothetical protein
MKFFLILTSLYLLMGTEALANPEYCYEVDHADAIGIQDQSQVLGNSEIISVSRSGNTELLTIKTEYAGQESGLLTFEIDHKNFTVQSVTVDSNTGISVIVTYPYFQFASSCFALGEVRTEGGSVTMSVPSFETVLFYSRELKSVHLDEATGELVALLFEDFMSSTTEGLGAGESQVQELIIRASDGSTIWSR